MEYKVLKNFYGYAESRLFEEGEVVNMTKKRAEEVNEKLKPLGEFLERVQGEEIEDVKED